MDLCWIRDNTRETKVFFENPPFLFLPQEWRGVNHTLSDSSMWQEGNIQTRNNESHLTVIGYRWHLGLHSGSLSGLTSAVLLFCFTAKQEFLGNLRLSGKTPPENSIPVLRRRECKEGRKGNYNLHSHTINHIKICAAMNLKVAITIRINFISQGAFYKLDIEVQWIRTSGGDSGYRDLAVTAQ